MQINRDFYLQQLISKKENGYIKVITGIRRCGKSYLLFQLYGDYLRRMGVAPQQIIRLALDDFTNIQYRNPFELDRLIREACAKSKKMYYVFLDEIQFVFAMQNPYIPDAEAKITFVDVLLGLMKLPNVDLYVTGSNSKMLSSDILTQFRDRGDEIRIYPLSYQEFVTAFSDKALAWSEYYTYGGMPRLLELGSYEEKSRYLSDLFQKTYLTDIMERNVILNDVDVLDELLNIISSSIGSLTSPYKLANTFQSKKHISIKGETIAKYLNYFKEAFVIEKAMRYDVKGKKYIETPTKYYFTDIGLRNVRLNFRQMEESHIMENIIYNELVRRGYNVDVGMVEAYGYDQEENRKHQTLEVDFVVNQSSKRYYIQSALTIAKEEKRQQETLSLSKIDDSFKKIVIVKDKIVPWHDETGILYLGVEQFLLEDKALDF